VHTRNPSEHVTGDDLTVSGCKSQHGPSLPRTLGQFHVAMNLEETGSIRGEAPGALIDATLHNDSHTTGGAFIPSARRAGVAPLLDGRRSVETVS
jgi:hypothetical protein